MADNTTLNPGTGGDVIATDDIGGVKYQITKNAFGGDGVATPVSAANPMPVSAPDGSPDADRVDLMLYFLGAILEKMPTPDSADRTRVTLEASTQSQMALSGISNPSTGAITPMNSLPFDFPNMASARLYDQVVFS